MVRGKPPAFAVRQRSPLRKIHIPNHTESIMKRSVKAKADKIGGEAPAAPPRSQEDVEQRRRALVRKLAIFMSDWSRCPRAQCRRARACRLPDLECFGQRETPERTPEQEEEIIALLQRELARRRPPAWP
jgi:hypothetical protein